ncbi:serine/threonine-protein phosphatase 7 long form homolog isoform X2 [Arachis hypogaea]
MERVCFTTVWDQVKTDRTVRIFHYKSGGPRCYHRSQGLICPLPRHVSRPRYSPQRCPLTPAPSLYCMYSQSHYPNCSSSPSQHQPFSHSLSDLLLPKVSKKKKKIIMSKIQKSKDVNCLELRIIRYLNHSDYSLQMLRCNHPVPPDRYDNRVADHLRFIGFYHASQIGIVQCQKALVNALVERWHPETHTFHLLIGECAVTLEDVAMILGLPTDGLPVTGMTISNVDALEAECLHQFGVTPRKSECRGSGIKIGWLRNLKERQQLIDEESKQRYVKVHIMLLFSTILLGDKSGASVHWKFLPLLREFGSIVQFSWGSACLAHLYRALCRASRFDCKEINDSLTLLLVWAWMRLPFLAPIPRKSRSFSLANR